MTRSTYAKATIGNSCARIFDATVVIVMLKLFVAGTALADNINLDLWAPQNCECGWVSINGSVFSDGSMWGLTWDWGDGAKTTSWFPASHRYDQDGVYTVEVTAVGCTTETRQITVTVTNTDDPGCPTDSAPSCGAYPCRYLDPANMHLVAFATSDFPLRILDEAGSPVAETAAFSASDPSLVSVGSGGYVTALRAESTTEIGSWISATSDGRAVANSCVARVLPADYAVPFENILGANTALYYPTSIGGEDLASLVSQHQIPQLNEYAYTIQEELMGLRPFGGCRQIFEVDLGFTEQSRVCGISGNPVRLGWNIDGNAWQNCFLVPFSPPRSPQWFVFYHELGHNFSWAAPAFGNTLGVFHYSEGVASVLALAAMHRALTDPAQYPLGAPATSSLQLDYDLKEHAFLQSYDDWVGSDANFSALNPDIVDGIWLTHAQPDLDSFAARFFLPLQPRSLDYLGEVLCAVSTDEDRHTFYAALVSAAAGADLWDQFADTYHYPLHQGLYDLAYAALSRVIEESGPDTDGDGHVDNQDNCFAIPNPNQTDTNNDGIGNACDTDIAGPGGVGVDDCNTNFLDLNVMRTAFFSTPQSPNWNPDADFTQDGAINFPDLQLMSANFFRNFIVDNPSGIDNNCME